MEKITEKLTLLEKAISSEELINNFKTTDYKSEYDKGFRIQTLEKWTNDFNKAFDESISVEIIKNLVDRFGSSVLNYSENPLINFLVRAKKSGITVTNDIIDQVIELIGKHVITPYNLSDDNSILYVSDLWSKEPKEITYLIQLYYWMLKNGKARLFNKLNKLSDEHYSEFIQLLRGIKNEKVNLINLQAADSNLILFKNPQSRELNYAGDIQSALTYLDSIGKAQEKKVSAEVNPLKDPQLDNYIKSLTDKEYARNIVNYLTSKFEL